MTADLKATEHEAQVVGQLNKVHLSVDDKTWKSILNQEYDTLKNLFKSDYWNYFMSDGLFEI